MSDGTMSQMAVSVGAGILVAVAILVAVGTLVGASVGIGVGLGVGQMLAAPGFGALGLNVFVLRCPPLPLAQRWLDWVEELPPALSLI